MITLKEDSTNPSSNFEQGIRSNFWNIFFKFATVSSVVGTGIWTVLNFPGFWPIVIWYAIWLMVLMSVAIPIFQYSKKMLNLAEYEYWYKSDDDELGCFVGIFQFLLSPIVLPMQLLFNKTYADMRNRFVWYKGKGFVFLKDRADPLEVESYNPFFVLWLVFFREADNHDEHAQIIDKELKERDLQLPALSESKILEFRKMVDTFLELEFKDPDTFYHNEDRFIEYLEKNTKYDLNEGLKLYARDKHKKKMQLVKVAR